MKRAKKAPRRENQAQARASSLDRGRENHICAMLMVSAEEAAFKAIANEKSGLEGSKNESSNRLERLRMCRMMAWQRPV